MTKLTNHGRIRTSEATIRQWTTEMERLQHYVVIYLSPHLCLAILDQEQRQQ